MIDLVLLCFGTAALACFIECSTSEDMIFHGYYKAIEKLPVWLFKPLGGCLCCMGTWVYIIISACVFSISGVIYGFIGFFLGIGINYIFIRLFDKYVVQ